MPSEWVLQVVDKVSEYVAERVGLSLEDFAAVLRREKEVEDSGVVEKVGYFATVTARVLRRLGGEYEKVAEELERNSKVEKLHPEDTNLFTVGQPVGGIYGIKSVFAQIINRGHVAIYAPPGIGKNPLLQYLASSQVWEKQKLDPLEAVIIFLSCKNITPFTSSDFWIEVLKLMRDKFDSEPELQAKIEILLEEGKNTFDIKSIHHILKMLRALEKSLVLLVDDYDFDLPINYQYTETDIKVFFVAM